MKKVLFALLLGFGGTGLAVGAIAILVTQPVWVQILGFGGFFSSVIFYCLLTREEHVYLCYHVGDTPNDVRVKAVCTTWMWREAFMEEGDCYREVPIDKEIPEATWEDLQYKTKDGYMTVE